MNETEECQHRSWQGNPYKTKFCPGCGAQLLYARDEIDRYRDRLDILEHRVNDHDLFLESVSKGIKSILDYIEVTLPKWCTWVEKKLGVERSRG